MKITGNYYNNPIGNKPVHKQNQPESKNFKSHMQNLDSITITAPKEKIIENQFITSLRGQISAELKAEKPTEELNSLSDQISRGTYEIGASEIAKKILLSGSES